MGEKKQDVFAGDREGKRTISRRESRGGFAPERLIGRHEDGAWETLWQRNLMKKALLAFPTDLSVIYLDCTMVKLGSSP